MNGPAEPEAGVRLQKVLAAAGLGSRRKAEILIASGRISVDGRVVTEQGLRVDPRTAVVEFDGRRIPVAPGLVVLAFNKPIGVVTAMSDPQGRPCVGDYVADRAERLFHVGRLDAATEGLLLLTNDGDLAHRLQHPRHGVAKTYLASIDAPVPRGMLRRLRDGIELDDGPARVDKVGIKQINGGRALVEVTLHEGRNRIVRRMFEAVDRPVRSLVRTRVGPLSLAQQRPGTLRTLHGDELRGLYQSV